MEELIQLVDGLMEKHQASESTEIQTEETTRRDYTGEVYLQTLSENPL